MAKSPLHRLHELGQSPWIDYLSRNLLKTGKLARLIEEDSIRGVTSNPTIFQKAISEGDAYDEQLKELAQDEEDPKELFIALASRDVSEACDLLRPYWDEGVAGCDGYVSIEVDPGLAYDTQATLDQAKHLWDSIDKQNLYVKIPGTEPGLPAIEDMIASGRSVNVTLLFSLERYSEAAVAYVNGIERLVADGQDPTNVNSVASFFVSRVDTEVDRRLDEIGGHDELKGKLAVANAKLAYQAYKEIFSGERWEKLAAKGASPQRCLWASTSTKNPDYRDVIYVEELIGPQTVNTMPEDTIRAFQEHGEVALTLEEGLGEAREVFADLAAAGIDYDDVVATLEREGVQKFSDSFDELLEGIQTSRRELVTA